ADYLKFRNRIQFVFVYTREAHPTEAGAESTPDLGAVCLPDPKTMQQREAHARRFARHFRLSFPIAVDGMDDEAATSYDGTPERLFVIDRAGKFAYVGGIGPEGCHPAELGDSLDRILSADHRVETARCSSQRDLTQHHKRDIIPHQIARRSPCDTLWAD